MVNTLGYATFETAAQKRDREGYENRLQREFERLAGKGTVDELERAEGSLKAEQAEIAARVPEAHALQQMNDERHGAAYREMVNRSRDLNIILGNVGRALRAAREERGEKLALAFVKDAQTQAAFSAVAEAWAKDLEPVAVAANHRDAAVKSGAKAAAMPLLPYSQMTLLTEFVKWAKDMRRAGIDVSAGLPEALRVRIEAS